MYRKGAAHGGNGGSFGGVETGKPDTSNTGMIVGIVIGSLLGLGAISLLGYLIYSLYIKKY